MGTSHALTRMHFSAQLKPWHVFLKDALWVVFLCYTLQFGQRIAVPVSRERVLSNACIVEEQPRVINAPFCGFCFQSGEGRVSELLDFGITGFIEPIAID